MRHRRFCDLLLGLGLLALALCIGEGQHRSAQARESREPLLWQLALSGPDGRVLFASEAVGMENQRLSVASLPGAPQLSWSLLPLGLPDGKLDVELELALNGAPSVPLRGLTVSPGRAVELGVPGHPYTLSLRALRLRGPRGLASWPSLVS